jgi:hypothetical protein
MSFHPLQITEFKNGVTPATGTIALGTTFQAEFVQLYENDNFLKAYFGTDDRLTVDEVEGKDAAQVKFLDPIGLNVDPVTNLHLHQLDSGANLLHFTNTSTGLTAADGLDIGIDASEQGRIWNYENTDIVIGTNNTDRIHVTAAGGLAIGTTTVKGTRGKVHILYGAANADTNWNTSSPLVVESNTATYINLRTPNNKESGLLFSDPDATFSGLIEYGHTTNVMDFYTAGAGRMRINATGLYIGGVADPSNPLTVISTTNPQFRVGYDANSYMTIGVADGGATTITSVERYLVLATNASYPEIVCYTPGATLLLEVCSSDGAEWLSLSHNGTNGIIATTGTNAGNIVITNTTECTGADTGALQVDGGMHVAKNLLVSGVLNPAGGIVDGITLNGPNMVTYFGTTTATKITGVAGIYTGVVLQLLLNTSPDDNTSMFLRCGDSTTDRLRIYSDGDVVNHDNSYGAISDIRLKENIKDTKSVLDNLMNLKVKDFNFKTDSKDKTQTGLIAQEVEKYFPEFVKDSGDKTDSYKILAYSKFIPILIKAIQEQQEIIDKLRK